MEYPLKRKYLTGNSAKRMKASSSNSGNRSHTNPDNAKRKTPAPNHPTLVVDGGTGAYRWDRS